MKVVKAWDDKEFYVEIIAEFKSKGESYLNHNWDRAYRDIVLIKGSIYKGEVDPIVVVSNEAKERQEVESRWFKKDIITIVPIQKDYERKLESVIRNCEEQINDIRRSEEITDGLPDSLIGL